MSRKDILQFLNFKLTVAETYLTASDEAPSSSDELSDQSADEGGDVPATKRRRCAGIPCIQQRIVDAKHLPGMSNLKNSMRCRMSGCCGKSKVRCVACNIYLCMTADCNCFLKFHKNAK